MGSIKYRSLVNYAQILAGQREGMNLGLDGSIFIRKELSPGTFIAPRIGTQGSSEGATGASTDISAGTDDSIDIAVDGGAVVTVTVSLAGLTTGALIEAALESAINSALIAAGQDARVWVDFNGAAPDQYTIYSQSTGLTSSVVVTDAASDNVADDLGLGTANGGTEAAGVDDLDFLLYTTGGPTFDQPIESNSHRSGRFHSGIVKSKKNVEFDISAMVNFSGSAGDSLDNAVRLLLEQTYGTETVVPGTSIDYTQGLPNFFFSMARVSTIFGEYYNGCYARDYTLTIPGDDASTQQWTGRGRDASIAGIGQVDGAVVANATVTLNSAPYNHSERYTEGAYVMAVSTDGRTITAGADGSLTVVTVTTGSNQIVLSAPVDLDDDSYIVPWHPGAVQETGRDNIQTDLEGSVKLFPTSPAICVTSMSYSYGNDHNDLDNCFGLDRNDGFAAGNRATITLEMTMDLSGENLGDLVQARKFGGFQPIITLGDTAGRYREITAAKWIVSVPPIDLPENGTTPVTFSGTLYQSEPGAKDPVVDSHK